jgi:hypothetical protein
MDQAAPVVGGFDSRIRISINRRLFARVGHDIDAVTLDARLPHAHGFFDIAAGLGGSVAVVGRKHQFVQAAAEGGRMTRWPGAVERMMFMAWSVRSVRW